MRVVVTFVVLGAIPGVAHGQLPDRAPVEPASWLLAEVEGASVSPDDRIHGAAFRAAAYAAWAPVPLLELGAGLDARGAAFGDARGERAAGRLGLGVLALWVGTGAAEGPLAGGARLVASAGPRLFGWSSLDGGAPEGAVSLELDGSFAASDAVAFALALDGGTVWDGVGSFVAGAQLDAFVGEGTVRPFLGGRVRGSPGVPLLARLRLGIEAVSGPWALTAIVMASPPGDPEGHRLGLALSLVRRLDQAAGGVQAPSEE